jgi:hypothetical protein
MVADGGATNDTVADDDSVAASSAARSVTVVIAQATDTYDPAVIDRMGRRPGYWELRHTDPDTHRLVIDKVCVDKATGDRMVSDHGRIAAPDHYRSVKTTANWLGDCPGSVHAGEVMRHDGRQVDAWNGHGPDRRNGQDARSSHAEDRPSGPATPQDGHDGHRASAGDMKDRNGGYGGNDHAYEASSSSSWSSSSWSSRSRDSQARDSQAHNPHATPAERHGDAPPNASASESSKRR